MLRLKDSCCVRLEYSVLDLIFKISTLELLLYINERRSNSLSAQQGLVLCKVSGLSTTNRQRLEKLTNH